MLWRRNLDILEGTTSCKALKYLPNSLGLLPRAEQKGESRDQEVPGFGSEQMALSFPHAKSLQCLPAPKVRDVSPDNCPRASMKASFMTVRNYEHGK